MNWKAVVAGIAVIGGLLAIGGGLAYIKYRQISAAMAQGGPPEMPEAIVAAKVERISWRPTARLSGTAFAREWVTLSNEVAGTVSEVLFESGSVAEEGQLLLQLDTSTQQADLDAANASVRVAEANEQSAQSNLTLREANHRRVLQASESGAVTEMELDRSQAELDQARANFAQMKATTDQAKARARQLETTIAKMSLKAPFRARAGLRNIHPGQYLAEGTTVVGLQSIDDRIHLDFAVPQDQAWRVKNGDVVLANVPMLSDEPLPITVVAIDAIADRGTRNVRIRGEIANPGERIRPGMWVDVEVPIETPSERLAIPVTAVRRAPYGDHVFVIEPDPEKPERLVVHERRVRLGPAVGGSVIVVEGVTEGETIASEGSFKLRDRQWVAPGPPSRAWSPEDAKARAATTGGGGGAGTSSAAKGGSGS